MKARASSNNVVWEFSKIALGFWRLNTWGLTGNHLVDFVRKCMESGITTFDHADIYGGYTCEEIFGNAINGQSSLRSQMQIISKCGIKLVSERRPEHQLKTYDTGRDHIVTSVENSLAALHTDYLDVLLIHRPDPLINADETAEAFRKLRDSGKVLHFGVSNFLPHQFDLLQSRLDFPLVTNQVEISVLNLDTFYNGILDHCQQYRIPPMAWSPLAGGRLFSSEDSQALRVRTALEKVAADLGSYSIDQIALAWLLNHPSHIVPVIGSRNMDRIKMAAEAINIRLSKEQWYFIWIASTGSNLP